MLSFIMKLYRLIYFLELQNKHLTGRNQTSNIT